MHVDLIRLPETLMDPGDQPDAVPLIQFRQKLPGFLIPASQCIHDVLPRIVDENLTVLIDPVVFHGQLHPVQKDPVEQLRICGKMVKRLRRKQDLGDPVEGVALCFLPVMKGKCISVPILHVITPHTDAGILPGSRSGAGSAGGSAGSFHPRVFEKTSLSIFAMQYPMQGPCFA